MSPRRRAAWRLTRGTLELGGRTLVMGAINVTPDSFSDGGRFIDPDQAVAQGLRLLEEGADVLDIGGESTRPGSERVTAEEEIARVAPVIRELHQRTGAVISIDTMKAAVAQAALEAGAQIINDVTAFTFDPEMTPLAAASGAGVILMHMKGEPRTMQKDPHYDDVVAEVRDYLAGRARDLEAAGVARDRIMLDPGIGFGKTMAHNLALIRHLDTLGAAGYPVLLGASRKSFIGLITGRPVEERLFGTIGAHVAGALFGADMVRVHDVGPVREALLVADAVREGGTA